MRTPTIGIKTLLHSQQMSAVSHQYFLSHKIGKKIKSGPGTSWNRVKTILNFKGCQKLCCIIKNMDQNVFYVDYNFLYWTFLDKLFFIIFFVIVYISHQYNEDVYMNTIRTRTSIQ